MFAGGFNNIVNHRNSLNNGLVFWGKIDENNGVFVDQSGNQADGSWQTNGGASDYGTLGKFGKSVWFEGSDDYITIPHSTSLAITGDISVSAWIKGEDFDGDRFVVSKQAAGASTNGAPYILYMNKGRIRFGRGDGTAVTNSTGVGTNDTCTTRKWNHVAISMTGTQCRFFVNGAFVDVNTIDVTTADQGQELRIGIGHSGTRDYAGSIDDVRLWNRGLTDDEVSRLYNESGFAQGLMLGLEFDEGTGVVIDNSDYNNNGSTIGTGVTQSSIGIHKNGQSVYFDGDAPDDYINISHNYGSLALVGDMTFIAWVHADSLTASRCIISKSSSGVANPYNFYIGASGDIALRIGNGTVEDTANTAVGQVIAGEWAHVAAIKTGNTVDFYLNGTFVSTDTLSTTTGDGGGDVRVGGLDDGIWDFDGRIDHLQVYNRAITPFDIQNDYQETDGIGEYNNLQFWAKLDDSNGASLEDSSQNQNNGSAITGVTLSQTGKFNDCFFFGGDATSPEVNYSTVGVPTVGTGDFTCTTWFKTGYTADKMSVFAINNEDNLAFYVDGVSPDLEISILGINYNSINDASITDNTWHHAAWARRTGNLECYLDGVSLGMSGVPNPVNNSSIAAPTTHVVGRDGVGDLDYFSGLLDDVRFYDFALDPIAIRDLAENLTS